LPTTRFPLAFVNWALAGMRRERKAIKYKDFWNIFSGSASVRIKDKSCKLQAARCKLKAESRKPKA
jgi:hypothetical protein